MKKITNLSLPPLPILSGFAGMLLLLPATGFMIALLFRVCFGLTSWYHSIAPSFLQPHFELFAWHKAQFILCCLLLAAIGNLPATLQIRLGQGRRWPLGSNPGATGSTPPSPCRACCSC